MFYHDVYCYKRWFYGPYCYYMWKRMGKLCRVGDLDILDSRPSTWLKERKNPCVFEVFLVFPIWVSKNLRDNTCMGWTSTIFLGVDFQFMYDKWYWDVFGITPDVFINAKCFETLQLTMWTNSKNMSFWIQAFWSYRLKTKWKSSSSYPPISCVRKVGV